MHWSFSRNRPFVFHGRCIILPFHYRYYLGCILGKAVPLFGPLRYFVYKAIPKDVLIAKKTPHSLFVLSPIVHVKLVHVSFKTKEFSNFNKNITDIGNHHMPNVLWWQLFIFPNYLLWSKNQIYFPISGFWFF